MSTARRDALVSALLLVLVFILYRKVDRLWWTYDDVYNIHMVVDHALREFFTSGAVWPQKLFTPVEPVLFRGALAAFGLNTALWFAAHLLLFIVSALALFIAARAYLDTAGAFAAAALYVASVPVIPMVTQLSAIHYFFAIALAAAAVALHARGHDVAAAILYFVAMFAKEIVIPLAVLLVFLTPGDWRTRARRLAPYGIALAAYLVWRRAVIGTIAGGYGWAVGRGEWPSLITALPKKLVVAAAGSGFATGIALVLLLACGAALALRTRHAIAVFVVAMILAIGPVLPVSKEFQARYALVPFVVLAFAFAAGVSTLRRRAVAIALLVAAPLLAIAANRQEWAREFTRIRRMSDEGRVFREMPPNGLLRKPIMPPAAMGELNWLKCAYERRPCGASWFFDDLYLCTNDVRGKRVWEYAPPARSVVEITPAVPAIKNAFCASVRNAPLAADFHFRDDALFWTFGPYRDGRYRVLFNNGVQAFDVPATDGFRLPGVPGLTIRVEYQSPAGWATYSPEIALDFRRRPDERWSRR